MGLSDEKWFTKIHGLQLLFLCGTAGAFWGTLIGPLLSGLLK